MAVAKPSELVGVIGAFDPVSQGAGTVVSDYADMTKFKKVMFVLSVGVLGASATVDAVVKQATDSSGTGSKNLSPSVAITQLTKAGSDDNKQVVINVDAEQLDVAGNFSYVALSVTVGVAASLISVLVLGFEPRYGPASDNDISSVDEIVN
jgi:hypothetical protein